MAISIIKKPLVLVSALLLAFSFASSAQAATLTKPINNLGLTGYWKFDEGAGTTIGDSSGHGNTGTLISAPTWTSGKLGGALNFNGSSAYVNLGNPSSLSTSGSVTVSAWVNLANTSGIKTIAGRWGLPSSQHSYKIASIGGKFYMDVSGSGSGDNYLQTNTTLAVGRWYHVVGVYTAGVSPTLNVYVNGVLDNGVMTGSVPSSLYVGSSAVEIGRDSTNLFNGSIDDVRVYNRALSAAEVQALYNTGAAQARIADRNGLIGQWKFDEGSGTAAADSSNQGNNGTITNGAWVNGKHGSALSLNGSNSQVLVGNPAGPTGAVTIAAWIYKNTNTAWTSILDRYGSESLDCLALGFDNTSGKKLMFIWNATSADSWANKVTGNSDIPTGQWVHVAASSNGSTVTFYVNGVPDGTASSGAPCTTGNMYIGVNYAGNDEYFNGKIDDLHLYNRALSAAEIQGLYQEGAVKINFDTTAGTSLASGLVGYWSFNGPDVTDKVYDRSGNNNNGYFVGGATSSAKTIGKLGQALQFNGTSSYVQTYPNPVNVGNQMTISVWVKPNTYPDDGQIHEVYRQEELSETANNYGGYLLSWRGDLNQRWDWGIRQSDVGTKYPYSPTTTDIPTGIWTHLVLTADGTNVRGYINGVLKGTVSYDGTISNGRNLIMGAYAAIGSSKSRFFPGSIDEVRVYNRALSAAEVNQLYLAGK
jgi:hypothetical protein